MISTCCCSPSDSSDTLACRSIATPSEAVISATRASSCRGLGRCHQGPPSIRFSATVRVGTSIIAGTRCRCRATRRRAARRCGVGLPSTRMRPSSGCCMPDSMPISVDLPAPFSPSRTWTSPARMSRSTLSLATTPGKRLVTPSSTTMSRGLGRRRWERSGHANVRVKPEGANRRSLRCAGSRRLPTR